MESNKNSNESSKIFHWGSKEEQMKINSIRYNQDYRLIIVSTSKGYRIFSTSNFKLLSEENYDILNFGDIHIADLYYSSQLVFLLPSKFNKDYKNHEIIIYDDYFQNKKGNFKLKNESINNFFISKDIMFIITLKNIIIVELCSLKIIDIIEDIAYNDKIISINSFNYLAYSKQSDRKTIYINYFKSDNHRIISKYQKKIITNFDFIQIMNFSPLGDKIAAISIYGNKIHIYDSISGKLKYCIFLGPKIQSIEKLYFSEKKPNYLLFVRNDKYFSIYKLGKAKEKEQVPKCICNMDNDKDLLIRLNEIDKKNAGQSKPKTYSKNKNIREPHTFSDYDERLLFSDFDRNTHKDLVFINKNGKLFKYHFNKKKNGKMSPFITVQWF